ncbi:MAG TPA: DUF924 family protein [Chlamydiales bacterium]|nr:DUF924 family protein [Chlamydiales bacterium]
MKFLYAAISSLLVICSFSQPLSATEDARALEVLEYWFGSIKSPEDYPEAKAKIWFTRDDKIDNEIRNKFERLLLAASNGTLNSWKNTPRERLALIILLDQFPRNIYRNDPRAFSFDSQAQWLTLEGIGRKDDLQLLPVERVFFYLPFEHAENLPLQRLSVQKFKEIRNQAPDCVKEKYDSYFDYALKHYVMIEKFGRFPYRNEVLGRKSTPNEIQFLKDPDASF